MTIQLLIGGQVCPLPLVHVEATGFYLTLDYTTSPYPVWGVMSLAPAW